ncbi:DUF2785 domain-containing protein [Kitasatospora mediocidica]|uniref:DUF2785 domain-containing protein n=1 Tax=Kitasatospora mediocidica TaxID=58352 RepID=UPI00055B5DCE|nr:DUF2785 domain-containing protein [Kitasatospora mediocidica]
MTDWRNLLDDDTVRPTPELIAGLSAALRSADPVVRDDQAFVLLSRWIPDLPVETRRSLGAEMAGRFADPEIQARTFAPLILAGLVRRGDHDPAWAEAFARWYPAETDLRGYDAELGWLHAVAHGADLLGALGRCPRADPVPLLELAAARLLAPTTHLFDAMEDDRLGVAIALTLTRPELTEQQAVGWLEPIAAEFAGGRPGPVPAHVSNTLRTLRALYLLADRGVRPHPYDGAPLALPHARAVREAVATVLAIASPYAG